MALSKLTLDCKLLRAAMRLQSRYRSTAAATACAAEKIDTTVDQSEVSKLSKLSSIWWDKSGHLRPLHSMNKLRVQLVRDCLLHSLRLNQNDIVQSSPLSGFNIMDVGCGGGILAEPLARIGANVTGLDASNELIDLAKQHSAEDYALNGKIEYICGCVEDHAKLRSEYYDAVIASEVLEHVNEKEMFLEAVAKTVKPGGSIFITTLNKTMIAWVLGVIAAEQVLNLVPQETHDWEKFISPREVQFMLEKYGCYTSLIHGFYYNMVRDEWFWIPSTAINYALHAVKKK